MGRKRVLSVSRKQPGHDRIFPDQLGPRRKNGGARPSPLLSSDIQGPLSIEVIVAYSIRDHFRTSEKQDIAGASDC